MSRTSGAMRMHMQMQLLRALFGRRYRPYTRSSPLFLTVKSGGCAEVHTIYLDYEHKKLFFGMYLHYPAEFFV